MMFGTIFIAEEQYEKKYEKEINCIVDIERQIECINLSVGANNRNDFVWITNNTELFLEESFEIYNRIMSALIQESTKLYFVVDEEKETEFAAVEKHLGIWHRFKDVSFENCSKDYYLNAKERYAYALLDSLKVEHISILHCGDFVFVNDEKQINNCLDDTKNHGSVFNSFFNNGYLLAEFRNFYTEGNALAFYCKDSRNLDKVKSIALAEGLVQSKN